MTSKEEILNRTDKGLAVFRYYIPGQWKLGRNFLNPLYNDTKASCNIYFDKRSNCYRMKDFGNDEYSGDCFTLVGKLKNFNCQNPQEFVHILETIVQDMNLDLTTDHSFSTPALSSITNSSVLPEEPKPLYSIIQKSFSPQETDFWTQYGITSEVLRVYKVIALVNFKSQNKEGIDFCFQSSVTEPIFGYLGRNFIKVYRPFSDIRFLYGGNFGEKYCFGLEQLPPRGDTLYITGGEKDVLSLVSRGFHAICFGSETANIPVSIIRKLSHRFKHIVLLYDVDKTGLEASQKHCRQLAEFGVKRLVLPLLGTKENKDISDYFKVGNTRENFNTLFLEFLNALYSETMAILKPCEIDFKNPPIKSDMIISVNEVPLGTQGNLLGITGGEGTGKSNYASSLIAGAINSHHRIDTLGLSVKVNSTNQAILLYDTEQSEEQLYQNSLNVLKRAGIAEKPSYLHAYSLKGMSRKERLQAIVQSMDKFYYQYNGIQMVIIDGIADLVRTTNDESQSIELIDELYRLAGIYNTCIICVLHFTPNGLKLRGHLGSELQRKAATILSIENDKTNPAVSVVKALKVRNGSPLDVPLMQFAWDKEAGMHIYLGEKPKEDREERKERELLSVAKQLFATQAQYTYTNLCSALQTLLDIKERTAKSYVQYMRKKEIIRNSPTNENYFVINPL